MAQPIRTYTPHRNEREELRAKVENAPVQHGKALLAAYELLQDAQDHGVLDTLRGALEPAMPSSTKRRDFANTPEGVRAMRNFLALSRVFANLIRKRWTPSPRPSPRINAAETNRVASRLHY